MKLKIVRGLIFTLLKRDIFEMLENASAGATKIEDQCVQQKESCQMESIKDSLSPSIEVLGDKEHVLCPRITDLYIIGRFCVSVCL